MFYGVPHQLVKPFAPYLRLFTTALLRPLFAPHKVPVRIFLNEFFAMGRVPAIESAIGLVAGCSIQLVIVVQSLVQLKQLYGDAWEAFLGQAGAVILVGSAADDFTANYLANSLGRDVRAPADCQREHQSRRLRYGYGRRLRPAAISDAAGPAQHPPGRGSIWLAGLNDPLPAMFPPYYDDPLRPELKRRARANPYYRG